MKTGIAHLFLCLLSAAVFADPVGLPEIQTRETEGFHGPVHTVTENTASCEQKDGQWVPGPPAVTGTWEFDAAGRLVKHSSQYRDYQYEYDAAGHLTKESWRNLTRDAGDGDMARPQFGQTFYVYDDQGRMIRAGNIMALRYPGQEGLAFTRDISDYYYDAQGRLIEWKVNEKDILQRATRYSYDQQGREIGNVTTNEQGATLSQQSITYTAAGEKTVVTTGGGMPPRTERYDAAGRLLERVTIEPEKTMEERETWRYTEHGKEQHLIQRQNGKILQAWDKYFDQNDRLLSYTQSLEEGFTLDNSWVFNTRGDLIAFSSGRDEPYNPPDLTYKPYSTLWSYTYDAHGNWTSEMEFQSVFDQHGDPVIENGQPKMQCTKITREIAYYDEKK